MQWPAKLFALGMALALAGVFVALVIARIPGLVLLTGGGLLMALFKFNKTWLRRETRWRERHGQ